MARMPDNFIDLTVTSPPYDDMDADFNPIPKNGFRTYKGYTWDFKAIAKELYRVTKEGGVVVWVVGDMTINGSESLASSYQKIYFRQVGFNIHDTMIYNKLANNVPSTNRYKNLFEFMFILSKGIPLVTNLILEPKSDKRLKNYHAIRDENGRCKDRHIYQVKQNDKCISNIWSYIVSFNNTSKDKIAFEHPAIFPEQLAADHIISWSNEGNLIYDPFMGSGTTAKMAIKLKRNWIGSEISPEYCEIIKKRLDPILKQGNLF
jgi:site-specific DNA-methyltransferase (adenine-specific)